MRVLLTRTQEDAARTAKTLAGRGHEAIIAPLRTCVLRPSNWPQRPFDALLATSRHAFAGPPAPTALRKHSVFCVGEATAQAARAAGFTQAQALGVDGASLASAVLAKLPPQAALLYLAGTPRHPALEAALNAGGMRLTLCERYAMEAVPTLPEAARAALAEARLEAVLHYSSESARAFATLAEAAGLAREAGALLHACLSPAIAEVVAQALPGASLRVAAQPQEAALLDLLAP